MSLALRGVVTAPPPSLTRIAGVTVLERAVRTLWYAGVRKVIVAAPGGDLPPTVRGAIERLGVALTVSAPGTGGRLDPAALAPHEEAQDFLVIDGAALVDARLPSLLASAGAERFCLLPADREPEAEACRIPSILAGRQLYFAGGARVGAGRLATLDFSDPEGLAAGAAAAVEADPGLALDLSSVPDYRADMRAHVPFLHMPIRGPQDNARAKRLLLAGAQKRVLDWPAWYLHRPVENAIISRICEWPVSPNQLTVLTNVVAFAALGLFASGDLGVGLALALVVGVLDGLDGKQARVKLHFSPIGEWEHHLDKIYENGWYAAIAWHLSGAAGGRAAWLALAVILCAGFLDIALTGAYRARLGMQFDDSGPFARRFRVVAGRRNTYLWTFAPFVVIGEAALGFAVVAAYAGLSFLVKGTGIAVGLLSPRCGERAG